ncbi:ATP citrate lyase citrate-binding domain-containing protein [Phorcysia thermohydrogeniphila]|uniref:ATP citrate synthase n=1 Tax=Phorcysia thermohydrogeniphila TaxID=936138 RepID=A0A4R1GHF8_9BACT|nr:ATP citrate lyase citrate-binding domain-containing protein [Phorcysia thermohydrogeniphila]TCK05299.1 ATP-citrate lyase beta-subunit [Phorcysia thermohydrogeniphila]
MAQRGIREFDGKRILAEHWSEYFAPEFEYDFKSVLVTPQTDLDKLPEEYPWLKELPLVAKPDMLFGKRGKLGLILFKKEKPCDVDYETVKEWIKQKMQEDVEIKGKKGKLTHFLIEPCVPHAPEDEYYVAITLGYEGDHVYMSAFGGIDVEENWDKVREVVIPVLASDEEAAKLIEENVPEEIKNKERYAEFVKRLYKFFKDMHFAYLEINPLVMVGNKIYPLDFVGRLDDTAQFLVGRKWGDIEFPAGFGGELSPEEKYIKEMDEKSGASLKLTILNPEGRIWTLVAGGGASVVYADTVADLGYVHELANYGEYSGNPSRAETREYVKTVLDLMTRKKDPKGRPKILIIGGAIANFTDVAKTFDGIIDAFKEYADKMKEVGVKIYVRRGGPNYEVGLARIKKAAEELGLPIEVYGPETHMTAIVKKALDENP